VASAGAAVAFYFATKASDQARSDILNASLGTTTVPDLRGMKIKVRMAGPVPALEGTPDDPKAALAEGRT
jgi:hypothetical protein